MSTPEIVPNEPQAPQPEVQQRQEQFIVPETQQQLGVTAPPVNPQPVQVAPQVVVQPVVTDPSDPTVFQVPATVAKSEKELEEGAKGSPDLSITWLDVYWLREIHKRLKAGFKVLFSN